MGSPETFTKHSCVTSAARVRYVVSKRDTNFALTTITLPEKSGVYCAIGVTKDWVASKTTLSGSKQQFGI